MQKSFLVITLFVSSLSFIIAQDKDKLALEAKVQLLKNLMIDPDKGKLESLISDQLTYGHSGGLIENKTQCIENLVSGNSDFIDITLSNQQSSIVGSTAWVRFDLFAHTKNKGVPAETNLKVLLIWVKVKSDWKLLARQAVKILPAN